MIHSYQRHIHAIDATAMFSLQVTKAYLQDEDEIVNRLATLIQVVLLRALGIFIEPQILSDVGMLEDPQQNLIRDL